MSGPSRTLAEWREDRGLTREELAERAGVTASMVGRWEEIGLDAEPGSRYGDYLVSRIMDALDVDGSLRLEHAPSEPKPGDLVVTPGEDLGVEDLLERAEELDVRITIPDRFGLSLKPLKEASEKDYAALAEHFEREGAYSESVARRMESALEMLGDSSGEWKEGQTVGERLDEMSREMGEDLDREAGQGPSGGGAA